MSQKRSYKHYPPEQRQCRWCVLCQTHTREFTGMAHPVGSAAVKAGN